MSDAAFIWKGLSFKQNPDLFKIGTDAILLGTWLPKLNIQPKTVLDVGTGTGILALHLAKSFPEVAVTAMDINPAAVALAKQNSVQNGFAARVRVIQKNILEEDVNWVTRFDLIVCNPPYFHLQLPSGSEIKRMAKHREGDCGQWMESWVRHRMKAGQLGIVVPSESAFEWIKQGNRYGWYVQNRLDVYHQSGSVNPKRTLLLFAPEIVDTHAEALVLMEDNGKFSQAYQKWLGK